MSNTSSTATSTPTITGGGISSAQQQQNLKDATAQVQQQLGIPDTTTMDYDTRLKFNKALAIVITTYPTKFSALSVTSAQKVLQENPTALDDTSFDLSAFGSAFADNALAVGQKIANAANAGLDAVGNTFSVFKYALPIIAVLGVALFVYIKAGGARKI